MEHASLRAETSVEGETIGVCSCGWRSRPHRTARAIGQAWDTHRAESEVREAG